MLRFILLGFQYMKVQVLLIRVCAQVYFAWVPVYKGSGFVFRRLVPAF